MPQSAIPPSRHAPVRPDWLDKRREEILEPDLPIVDPHHHLWDRPNNRYLFQDLLADVGSGHNIVATCFERMPRDVSRRRPAGAENRSARPNSSTASPR